MQTENKYLTLREIQLEELEILKNVTKYCEKYNLRYFLCSGTLIGAIRHQGFIPWDDDIDIFMPRPDYDKFIELTQKENIDDKYQILAIENDNSDRTFGKVINKNIEIESKSFLDKYLWIDIFPLDGLPDDLEEAKKVAHKNTTIKGQIYLRTTSCKEIWKEKKSIKNKILKIILKPIAHRHSTKYYSKKIIKIAKQNDYENAKYIGDIVWPSYSISIYKKEWFEKSVKVKFEDAEFNAPSEYDTYLKSVYGEYMKLPSEEKRITHNIKAIKIY